MVNQLQRGKRKIQKYVLIKKHTCEQPKGLERNQKVNKKIIWKWEHGNTICQNLWYAAHAVLWYMLIAINVYYKKKRSNSNK